MGARSRRLAVVMGALAVAGCGAEAARMDAVFVTDARLAEGQEVWSDGRRIGRVERVGLLHDRPALSIARMRIDGEAPSRDAVADIEPNGESWRIVIVETGAARARRSDAAVIPVICQARIAATERGVTC